MQVPVITVDGPSGTGKGTITRFLKAWLGWHLLDSGALYRVLAFAALHHEIKLNNDSALAALALQFDIRFEDAPEDTLVFLDNQNVSDDIRTEEAGANASRVAQHPAVREALLERQRRFRQAPGLVADGRDMGTVVFPQAALKIFVTASAEQRAQRRYKQLKQKGLSVNLRQLLSDIEARDLRDQQRSVAPLIAAPDAVILDTTTADIEAVENEVRQLVITRGLAHNPT